MNRPLALAALCLALTAACKNIEPGHVGVRIKKCSGGGIEDQPLPIGYHMLGPCTDIVEYPTYQQTLVLARSSNEGSPNDDSITVTSSEGLPINVDVSMSFTVDEGKVPALYKKFRRDLVHIEGTYMRQTVREKLQQTFAKYTAQQLYSDKREIARAEVQTLLTDVFAADGFLVTQFTLNETRVPDAVTSAINAKVAMVQEAQKAEQEVRKTQALAAQAIARAEGEAKAKQLGADAQAYSNQQISRSLTPALIEYLRIQKWNGTLPQVTSGSTPLLNLGGPKEK